MTESSDEARYKQEFLERTNDPEYQKWNPIRARQEANLPWGLELHATQGHKDDQGKSRVDLLDPDFLLAVGEVLRFGANKPTYGPHNWRNGIAVSRIIAGALRHLFAIMHGEDIDSESGLPHTAHLGCCIQFLHWTLKYKPQLDDRYKYGS
jgi:hypothetical protein